MFDLTETEKHEIFENGLRLKRGSGGSRPLARNKVDETDYAEILRQSEQESRGWRLSKEEYEATLAGADRVNATGLVRSSRLDRANRLLAHFAKVTFDITAELAEDYDLTPQQQFQLWGKAWQAMLILLLQHRTHPDMRCNEWLLDAGLLDALYDRVPELLDDDIAARITDDPTEQAILRGREAGKTSREIAAEIGKGKSTVNRKLSEMAERYVWKAARSWAILASRRGPAGRLPGEACVELSATSWWTSCTPARSPIGVAWRGGRGRTCP